jgi:hypothetical protein
MITIYKSTNLNYDMIWGIICILDIKLLFLQTLNSITMPSLDTMILRKVFDRENSAATDRDEDCQLTLSDPKPFRSYNRKPLSAEELNLVKDYIEENIRRKLLEHLYPSTVLIIFYVKQKD